VSGLLPASSGKLVISKSVFQASESFGVVALILLVVLHLQREALRVVRTDQAHRIGLSGLLLPPLVAVALTIAARLARLIR
jgi:hypothetical protein